MLFVYGYKLEVHFSLEKETYIAAYRESQPFSTCLQPYCLSSGEALLLPAQGVTHHSPKVSCDRGQCTLRLLQLSNIDDGWKDGGWVDV